MKKISKDLLDSNSISYDDLINIMLHKLKVVPLL